MFSRFRVFYPQIALIVADCGLDWMQRVCSLQNVHGLKPRATRYHLYVSGHMSEEVIYPQMALIFADYGLDWMPCVCILQNVHGLKPRATRQHLMFGGLQ